MTPIDTAYQAQAGGLATALLGAGFLASTDQLQVDPSSPNAMDGDEASFATAAALVKLTTTSPRAIMGGPTRRYVVERTSRLELGVVGPDAAARAEVLGAALAACAALPEDDPTLGGLVERFFVGDQEDDDLPPNGAKVFLTFTLRLRSGDPLGLTP